MNLAQDIQHTVKSVKSTESMESTEKNRQNICIIADCDINQQARWLFQKVAGTRIHEYTPLLFANRTSLDFETPDVDIIWINIKKHKEGRNWIQINHKDLDYNFFIVCVYSGNSKWVKDITFCEISLSLNHLLRLNFIDCNEFSVILTNLGHKITKPSNWLCGLFRCHKSS
jgi:hypothetical protein